MRLNVQFNPFTYEELIRPIADYNEAYNALAYSYATLSDQTEAFRNEVNATDSRKAYEQFNRYADDLGAAIDDFSKGMTSSNRANLLNMKRRYGREIGTIAKAAEARKAANDLRDKAGPDAIFEVSNYNSLDPFLEGETINNRYQSASNITATTAAMTEAVMAEVAKDPDLLDAIEGYKLMVQHSGGSYEDLMAAITNTVTSDPNTLNKFNEIKNRVKKDLGYTNYDVQGQAAIERAINTGLFAGLDKPTKKLIEDKNFMTDYEQWKWNKEIEEWNRKKEEWNNAGETPEDPGSEGEGIYFPNIEIGTEVSTYNTFNYNNLTMNNDGTITSSEIEDINNLIREYQEKKELLDNPDSPLYKDMTGYNLSKKNVSMHTMTLLSNQLTSLENKLQDLEKQLKNETDPDKIITLESQIRKQNDLILNKQDQIKGFAANVSLRNNYSSLIDKLETKKRNIQRDIDKYHKKYGHLSDDPVKAIQLGLSIDNQTSLSSIRANQISFGEDDKSSEYILGSLLRSAKASTTTNVYEVDDAGKPTSTQMKAKDLPENTKGLTLLYSDYGLMYSDAEGKKYLIKSDDYSRGAAYESEVIRKHLTDFSKENMRGAIMLEGNIVENGVLYNEQGLSDLLIKSGMGKVKGNTVSATLKQPNGDIINVVVYDVNKSPKIVYSSMYDLEQGGTSFSDNKNKYRQFRGAELIGTYVNRKPSASLTKDEYYTVE